MQNMMTPDQVKTVTIVFGKFEQIDNRELSWTNIDEKMSFLLYLTDEETIKEAAVQIREHKEGSPRGQYYELNDQFIQDILEAVQIIIDLYERTKSLHIKNRYILEYYMALSACEEIIS